MPNVVTYANTRFAFTDEEFPLHVMRVKSHKSCELHRHDFTELVLIFSGSGRHVTDTGAHPLEAGDAFVVTGNTAHGYERTDEMTLVNILFRRRALRLPTADLGNIPGYHALFTVEPRLRRARGFNSRLHLDDDELGEAARLVATMESELHQQRPGYRFMASSHLMTLIGFLSRCYARATRVESRPLLRLGEALSYMEHHHAEPITVAQLARVAGMSRSSLMRAFAEVMGRAPIEHLLRLRISRACELLAADDLRVTDVALQCGFNDSNYFSRAFHKRKGMSPREYRRLLHSVPRR